MPIPALSVVKSVLFCGELIATEPLFSHAGCFIRMYLERNDAVVDETFGFDIYPHDIELAEGTLLAATGRCVRHTGRSVRPPGGIAADIGDPAGDSLHLTIETDLFLSPGYLTKAAALRVRAGEARFHQRLSDPGIELDWPERGIFRFALGRLLGTEAPMGNAGGR